ncbi:MAG TPA: hypothetical protein PK992_16245 [Planctomycetaceae bacterium]|nr:hypothetical protein [Planctomycetaceae bacterium]
MKKPDNKRRSPYLYEIQPQGPSSNATGFDVPYTRRSVGGICDSRRRSDGATCSIPVGGATGQR